MALAQDTNLGPYKIVSLIGRGGMGEVYRARDTRLDREVAVKVLPASLAADEERIARFEREARLLATLSHQNIAGIYGLEHTNGTRYLVLELVEGETLAERLSIGSLPVEETLRLCCQIADGVASAHERGVLHRDLKPANIKITPDDSVKVLDFGIAKAFDAANSTTSLASAPTMTQSHHTAAGAVVGTPSYMSPEQARGKSVDKRTDIWSFGCVMYECLTGRIAFGGETATDAIAKILERDPDFAALPTNTPPTVQLLLRRCFQKDRRKRLHDIGDARVAIEEAIADPAGTTLGLSASTLELAAPDRQGRLPWLLAGAFAILAAVALWSASTPSGNASIRSAPTTHLALVPSDSEVDWDDRQFDLSQDGRMLAFVARPKSTKDAPDQIFLRRFDRVQESPVAGTERAVAVAFSPGGTWLAFLASDRSNSQSRKLKRVGINGTPPITVADLGEENYWDVSWLSAETLLLHGWDGKQMFATVSADGGKPQRIELDTSQLGDFIGVHLFSLLPEGRGALGGVFRKMGMTTRTDVVLIDLNTWACSTLLENADEPIYTPGGQLVFKRDRSLLAVPFDPASVKVTGRVMPLLSGVGDYRLSSAGTLAYVPVAGTLAGRQLFSVDAQGNTEPLSAVQRAFQDELVASTDGRWLAVAAFEDDGLPRIWACELKTASIRPISPAEDPCFQPCLSPDGQFIAYVKWSSEEVAIVISPIDGSEGPRTLMSIELANGFLRPTCWSPDATQLLVERWNKKHSDILSVPFEGGEPVPLMASLANEGDATVSPDGKFLAFVSDESGERILYVSMVEGPLTSLGTRRRVTADVGSSTVLWSRDGTTLYYIDKHHHLLAVDVTAEPALSVSQSRNVLDLKSLRVVDDAIASLPDGRFAFIRKGEQEIEAKHLNVVLNWFDELNAKVPVR